MIPPSIETLEDRYVIRRIFVSRKFDRQMQRCVNDKRTQIKILDYARWQRWRCIKWQNAFVQSLMWSLRSFFLLYFRFIMILLLNLYHFIENEQKHVFEWKKGIFCERVKLFLMLIMHRSIDDKNVLKTIFRH